MGWIETDQALVNTRHIVCVVPISANQCRIYLSITVTALDPLMVPASLRNIIEAIELADDEGGDNPCVVRKVRMT